MAEVERPPESDYFTGHPVVNSLFNPESMETFRSSPEHNPNMSKKYVNEDMRDIDLNIHPRNLSSKLEREKRRRRKEQERARLHQEVKERLNDELRTHESIQSQLHGARDSITRKRSYADNAEKELRELENLVSSGSTKEDQLAIELAKLQVELAGYQSKMEGAEQELQRARELTEELTTDRNKAKDEAQEMREERRRAAEQRRLDAARREGLMRGKLEGMYEGWEDGKILGYREGRKDGAHKQHDEMRGNDWKLLQRELPEYDRFEERIPSPVSTFIGDVPEPLKHLEAPIILPPPPKKARRPDPPPETVYYGTDQYNPLPVHSSPETTQYDLPPVTQPTSRSQDPSRSQAPSRSQYPTHEPTSSRSEQDPRGQTRPRRNIPPPRPIFQQEESTWEQPPSRPEGLHRSATQRALGAIGQKMKRKHEDIVPAPEHMDFAPFAAPLPYPSVATPLPQHLTMMAGRAVPTPAPSIYGGRDGDRDSEEEFQREMRQRRAQQEEEDENMAGRRPSFLARLNTALRAGPSRPAIDPQQHPLAYQEVQSTPRMSRLDDMTPSPSPSPLPSPSMRPSNISAPAPAPVWPPPASPRHPRPAFNDIFVPELDAQGKFTLPPPHEMEGSAMESAITPGPSQNPSRNPSPSPSNRSNQRPRSRDPHSRDPSPSGRLAHLGGSIKKTASAVMHAVPSRGKLRGDFRGRSRDGSPARSRSPDPIQMARERSRERQRSRSRSPMPSRVPHAFVDDDGLLRPENIQIGPDLSTLSDLGDPSRGRAPGRRGTAMSQGSGRSSPGGMSIQSNGALGLSRGGELREAGYVTYPNAAAASTANLSIIAEEKNRQSGYNPTPSPNFRHAAQNSLPSAAPEFFPPRPAANQRQYSDNSMDGGRAAPWEEQHSRFPPPPPSIRSTASGYAPTLPAKSPRLNQPPYPWSTRPVPAKITMPALLSAQSPAPSSRGGIAGIGAGGGYHKRALSATALSPGAGHNFASPHPSARLSVAGSFAGSDSGRPPIAPKPHPPSRRNPIKLDDPLPESPYQHPGHAATRSWSGEKQQILRTVPSRSRRNSAAVRPGDYMGAQQPLVTVEERSPYLQGPEGRRSTGSLASVHSARMLNDQAALSRMNHDPAFLIQSELTAALEQDVGQPRPPSDEGPPKVARPSVGKRVSKVLKFGKKGK